VKLSLFCLLTLAILAIGLASSPQAHAAPTTQFEEKRFAKLDTNGDKKLSEEEFVGEKAGKSATKAKKEFVTLDKNGNKSLTFNEFQRR
jgi:hypothetical protein